MSSFPKRYENMDHRLRAAQHPPPGGDHHLWARFLNRGGAPSSDDRRRRCGSEEKEAKGSGVRLDATYQEIPEPMEEGQFHRDRYS
jgi:hypothetical protein